MSNAGTITTLTNSGTISGGAAAGSFGGAGGAGIRELRRDQTLTNSGRSRRLGGSGSSNGAPGDAIYSAGANASIGSIANSGSIVGNVEIDNQSNVTITGGSGKVFGSLTGGTIVIGNGNLTFGRRQYVPRRQRQVNGGAGTLTNMDPLQIAAPLTITGNFTQTAAGALDLDFAGDVSGQYGALTITELATLDGGLGIDLTDGFTLATGDSFDILTFAGLTGDFGSLALDGSACSVAAADFVESAAEACF